MDTISEYAKEYQAKSRGSHYAITTDLEEIKKAVYSRGYDTVSIISNPLLSREQCRYLMENTRAFMQIYHLIKNPAFPSDFLHEVALTTKDASVLSVILTNPKTLPKTRVMLTLMGIRPARLAPHKRLRVIRLFL